METRLDSSAIRSPGLLRSGDISEQGSSKMILEGNLLSATATAQIEKNLASLGFFVPSGKRIKNGKIRTIPFNRFLDGRRISAEVIIIPSTRHGLPVTSDQDKYFALQRIITDLRRRHGTIQNPIGFRSAELLGILGRHSRSGRHYQRIREWLDLMAETTIVSDGAIYLAGSKTWASGRVRVFDRTVVPGQELGSGTRAAQNYVWLSGWQLENINHNHLLGLDLDSYLRLTNHVARALTPLLNVWLYASRSRDYFEKRYDELCRLLNLRCYRHASKIIEKLAAPLDELLGCGYLAGWSLETRRGGKGYKLRLHHGEAVPPKQRKHPSRRVQVQSPPTEGRSLELSNTVKPSGPDPALIEEMRKRGIPSDRARQLLSNLAGDRLVMDQLEWGDHLIRSSSGPKISNPVGFYIYLVKENITPPETFETSRIRRLREKAETARVKQLDEREQNARSPIKITVAKLLTPISPLTFPKTSIGT
jgi:Replication initiator protein A